jgi:hypothetical protein
MKKINLFLLFALISLSTAVSAQQLVLTVDTSTNTTQVVNESDIVQMNAYLKNLSGSDTNIFWEVESISGPSSWTSQFCDKYSCIDINVLPNSSYDLANNDSSTMKGQVIPACEPGIGVIRIKMWIEGDISTQVIGTYIADVTVDTSTCKVTTGITTIMGDEGNLVVYPNPAANDIYINLNSNAIDLQANVFDLNGRLIQQQAIENGSKLSLEELQTGLYILKVHDTEGGMIYTRKIMKQ